MKFAFHIKGFFLLIWGLCAFVVASGLGHHLIFKSAVLALFGYQLWLSYQNRQWIKLTTTTLCLITSWFFWPAVYLYGLWAFILSNNTEQNKYSNCACQALLVLWLLQATPQGSWCMLPFLAFFSFLSLCLFFAIMPKDFLLYLVIACFLITIVPLLIPHEPVQIAYDSKFTPNYRHGVVLAKLLNGKLKDPNNLTGEQAISSLIQNSGENHSNNPIILVDHDQFPNKNHTIIMEGNLTQPEPWYLNQFIGNQYLLAAIADDGQWVSNIGGRLNSRGKLLLAIPTSTGIHPLIVKVGNIIYVNDSDAFVDRLANYQKATLTEIVYGNSIYRIINITFLFGILFRRCRPLLILTVIIVCASICFYLYRPVIGDVRVVGKIYFPHEPSKISGIMRSFVDGGYPYTRGNKNCEVLAVDSDKLAYVTPSEKLVVGCERADIEIGDNHIYIDQLSLGDVNDVVDARDVIVNGIPKGPCARVNDVIVLGTGSPSKQKWSLWLH